MFKNPAAADVQPSSRNHGLNPSEEPDKVPLLLAQRYMLPRTLVYDSEMLSILVN